MNNSKTISVVSLLYLIALASNFLDIFLTLKLIQLIILKQVINPHQSAVNTQP